MINIYLAGNMDGRDYNEILVERAHAMSRFEVEGFRVFDPLDCIEAIDGEICIEKYDGLEMSEIIARDELALKKSDVVVVLTGDKPSSGTWFEFAFAHYCLKIPIVVIAPKLKENKTESWTTAKATKVVSSVDEAAAWLSKFFEYELIAIKN